MQGEMPDDLKPRRHLVQDVQRLEDVEQKHERVRRLLKETGADALLLQDPASIAWFTAGSDLSRYVADPCQTSLFVTAEARLFATNAVDSALVFEREVFGLGFQLKQREWFQPHANLISDLIRGRRVISDSGLAGTRGAARRIIRLRLPLSPLEVTRLRQLSKVVVHAVEVTARNVRAGVTEAAVAGEVSHRLVRRTVTPVRIQVCADGRNQRYRHWAYGEDPVARYAAISCVARRWGLHVAVTRTVVVDKLPQVLWNAYQKTLLIHGTAMYFSRHGEQLKTVWPRVRRIYEKFGMASEWQLADQADVIGYRCSEIQLTPDSDFTLESPVAVFWHPSAADAMVGDTVLVTNTGSERLTRSTDWPELQVQVRRREVPCPGILRIGGGDTDSPVSPESASASAESSSPPLTLAGPVDVTPRLDSSWEMDVTSGRSIFEDDESPYSEESVLD